MTAHLATALLLPLLPIAAAVPASAAPDNAPYTVSVSASVLFAPDGSASDISVMEDATLPAAFVNAVKARLQRARIPPQLEAGAPASFRTGVLMDLVVTPGSGDGSASASASSSSASSSGSTGGKVVITSLVMSPLPIKQYFPSYPADISQSSGWKGSVQASCVVGVEGRCTSINVQALPGMPESVRRYAKASLEGWLFQPQQLNGKAVEGEYKISLNFETLDSRPDNLRTPKLDRVLQGR